ncbi:MAG: MarR family transcriptional regulator [Rhodospirillales bacterium CG15_BIG_FIL_POST_REV_8_21_14_020_66_15]|nr:MAG: MarR family transcriptional regulator [Rhodospirillales bacterium CG15_BIG_FIL_POST_REV_8_21_14_020_66_15]
MANGKFDAQNHNQMVETTLDLLDAVAEDETISQRGLAEHLGVALGLTNAVLKRCVKKGLLKISQIPAKRYAYYLTPQGFAEKSRLTAEYLSHSLQFYRTARHEYTEIFRYCATRGWRRVVVVGATELAEIASLATTGTDVTIVGVLDPGRNEAAFCDLPVFQTLEAIPPAQRPHAVVITDLTDPQSAYDKLTDLLPADRVLAPKLVRISVAPAKESGVHGQ